MKQILLPLGRFTAIGFASFILGSGTSWLNHRGYWYGTIYRVQTVDFNILSHTLPTKLSSILIQGNTRELQSTLDSNYGLFGLVVTNCRSSTIACPNQKILYSSNSNLEWRKQLRLETLVDAPYSVLRSPAPLVTETEFEESRATNWRSTGKSNPGVIIGRVYYVRGIPPRFWSQYTQWLLKLPKSLLSDSGAQKYYALTLSFFVVTGLAVFCLIELLLYRKRVQKSQAQKEHDQTRKELESTRHQVRELLDQDSSLKVQLKLSLDELKSSQEQNLQLNQLIQELELLNVQLEDQIVQQKQQEDTDTLENTLSKIREETQQDQKTIETLQWQIDQAQPTEDQDESILEVIKQELETVKQRYQISEEQRQLLNRQLSELRAEIANQEQNQREEIDRLTSRLHIQSENAKRQKHENKLKRQQLEKTIEELERREQQKSEALRILDQRIAKFYDESDVSLDGFERTVQSCLESSWQSRTEHWIIQSQLDVCQGRARRITDFIIVSKSCVFIIEAKYYIGRIMAEGDVKNVPWVCRSKMEQCKTINSAGGGNPYKQVLDYTNHMMGRVRPDRARGKVGVHGIVVFPEEADVKPVQSAFGEYYAVTTLNHLVQVVQEQEASFTERYRHMLSPLSPQQLTNLILGK